MEWNKLTSSSGVQTKTSSVDAIFDSVLTISMRSLLKKYLELQAPFYVLKTFADFSKRTNFRRETVPKTG